MDDDEGDSDNGIYTYISGSYKVNSNFPYSSNPETAPNMTLNSDVPGTYIFPLNSYGLRGNLIHFCIAICLSLSQIMPVFARGNSSSWPVRV